MRVVLRKHRMASRGGHTGLCLEADIRVKESLTGSSRVAEHRSFSLQVRR